jgi:hypothetical protein
MRTCILAARFALVFVVLACGEFEAKCQNPAAQTAIGPVQAAASRSSVETPVASHPALEVDYHAGQLAIHAQNSSLAEILKLIGQRTGASIHVPPGSGLERVVEDVGPGPIRRVLEHLLNGSSFNFVIITSPQSSDPKQIVLTLQGGASPQPAPPAAPAPAQSVLWTPPDTTDRPIPLSAEVDDTLVAPKETMTPEALSDFMRQKQRELREKAQQQYPQ